MTAPLRRLAPLLAALAATLLSVPAATAAPSDLDPTYGTGGLISRDVLPGTVSDGIAPQAVARLDDGTSIIAGTTANERIFVVRLTDAGTLDPSWGGYRYVDPGPGTKSVAFLEVHGSTITLGGRADDDGYLAQLQVATGTPASGFGSSGIVVHQDPSDFVAFTDGTVDTDGGIYVAVGTNPVTVRRYLPTGALDPAFGINGVSTATSNTNDPRVALDGSRRLVVSGSISGANYRVFRLKGMADPAPGNYDPTFNGPIDQTSTSSASAVDVAVDSFQRVYLLGARPDGYEVIRLTATGDLDNAPGAFGTGGRVLSNATGASNDRPTALAMLLGSQPVIVGTTAASTGQPWVDTLDPSGAPVVGFNGGIVRSVGCDGPALCSATAVGIAAGSGTMTLVGTNASGLRGHAAVVRNDGTLDTTFGGDGRLAFAPTRPWGSFVIDSVLAADGSLYTLGNSGPTNNEATWVTKQRPDGTPDPTFGTDGRVSADLSSGGPDYGTAVALGSDGAIYTTRGVSGSSFSLQRWTAAGRDTTYGAGGDLAVTIGGTNNAATSLTSDAQGRLIVGGDGQLGGNDRIWLVRVIPTTGAIDPTWNGGAPRFLDAGAGLTERLGEVRVLSDGSIAAAGQAGDALSALRVSADGTPLSGFGSGGVRRLPELGTIDPGARGLIGGSPGALVVGGTTVVGGTRRDIVATRISDQGTIDVAFGAGGVARIGEGDAAPENANALGVDASGRTTIVGDHGEGDSQDALIARLTSSGTLDATFGTAGVRLLDLSAGGATDRFMRLATLPGGALLATGEATDAASRTERLVTARFIGGPPAATPTPTPTPTATPLPPGLPNPPVAAFVTTISAPGKPKARKRLVLKGTATATPSGVQRVEVSIRLITPGTCRFLRSASTPRFTAAKPVKRACSSPVWLRAKGAAAWSLTLRRGLPRGRYEIRARTIPRVGAPEGTFASGKNKLILRVR